MPSTRKVNNKALNSDISLTATDVGALTQTQGDNRYEIKGYDSTYKYITAYSGNALSGNQAVTLPQDCRGCWFYFLAKNGSASSGVYIPDDNIEESLHAGKTGYAIIRLENNGKTFRCISFGDGGEPVRIKVRVKA
ncbi:hypothetical protein MASR2M36_06370 [Providencia sp.]